MIFIYIVCFGLPLDLRISLYFISSIGNSISFTPNTFRIDAVLAVVVLLLLLLLLVAV